RSPRRSWWALPPAQARWSCARRARARGSHPWRSGPDAPRGPQSAFGRALQEGRDAIQVRVGERHVDVRLLELGALDDWRGLFRLRRGLFRLRLDLNGLLLLALRLRLGRLDVAEINGIETGG